jgi:hypothetical protein
VAQRFQSVRESFQASLRDAARSPAFPALEAPGYYQMPLWGIVLRHSRAFFRSTVLAFFWGIRSTALPGMHFAHSLSSAAIRRQLFGGALSAEARTTEFYSLF